MHCDVSCETFPLSRWVRIFTELSEIIVVSLSLSLVSAGSMAKFLQFLYFFDLKELSEFPHLFSSMNNHERSLVDHDRS